MTQLQGFFGLLLPRAPSLHGMDTPVRLNAVQRVVRWLDARSHLSPPWVVMVQLFLGFGWLRAVAEKIIDPEWWTGAAIERFLVDHRGRALEWYEPFVSRVVEGNLVLVAATVVAIQLFAGLALLGGRQTGLAIGLGVLLNLNFVAAGAVNPSAFYLVMQGALALWLFEQGRHRLKLVYLDVSAVVLGMLGLASIRFISTVHPAEVIDDPAAMLSFMGVLAVVANILAKRSQVANAQPKTEFV